MKVGWLAGWKEIAQYIGGVSVRTAHRYRQKHGLPIRYLPSGKPVAIMYELDRWLIHLNEIRKKKACQNVNVCD